MEEPIVFESQGQQVVGMLHVPDKHPPEGAPAPATHFDLDRRGNVSRGTLQTRIPQLAGWSSRACTEHTLAVTLPHSHYIFLVGVTTKVAAGAPNLPLPGGRGPG